MHLVCIIADRQKLLFVADRDHILFFSDGVFFEIIDFNGTGAQIYAISTVNLHSCLYPFN